MKLRYLFIISVSLLMPPLYGADLSVETALKQLEQKNTDANTLFSLSFYFQQAGRPFSAIRAAKRAIQANPKLPGCHARLGQLLMTRKRYPEAAAAYKAAIAIDPDAKAFRAAAARALEQCGRLKEAVEPWTWLLEHAADEREIADAAAQISRIQYAIGNAAGAEAAWRKAIALSNDVERKSGYANNVATALRIQGKEVEGASYLKEYIEQLPNWERKRVAAHMLTAYARKSNKRNLEIALAVWTDLRGQTEKPDEIRRAALEQSSLNLQIGNWDQAVADVDPLLSGKANWNRAYELALAKDRGLGAQGDRPAREALWRWMLKRADKETEIEQAAGELAKALPLRKAITLYRDLLKNRCRTAQMWTELAGLLARNEEYLEAADAHLQAMKLRLAKFPRSNPYQHHNDIVENLIKAGRVDLMVDRIRNDFGNSRRFNLNHWMNLIVQRLGEATALATAYELGEDKQLASRVANFLRYRDKAAARRFYEIALEHAKKNERRQILNSLYHLVRNDEERVSIARRMLNVSQGGWQKQDALNKVVMGYASQGRIAEALQVVRDAKTIKVNRVARALSTLAQHMMQGNKVGPALRSMEGLKEAEKAFVTHAAYYMQHRNVSNFRYAVNQMLDQFIAIHRVRDMRGRSVAMIEQLRQIKDTPWLCLKQSQVYEEKEQERIAKTYRSYAELAIDEDLTFSVRFPNVDISPLKRLSKERQSQVLNELRASVENRTGNNREAAAVFVMTALKELGKPETMKEVLDELIGLGVPAVRYRWLSAWIDGAIKMQNSTSKADTAQREQLLRQLRSWETTWKNNSEDYQAAINIFKTYLQLGRGKEGLPYLKKALKVQPFDPLVLESCARERMLLKDYAGALTMLKGAAEISGRTQDYADSLVAAGELAGDYETALKAATQSIETSQGHREGVRNVQQVLDIAERSGKSAFLASTLKERLSDINARGLIPREPFSRLALYAAWQANERGLATLAVRAIAADATDSNTWRHNWRFQQLINQATQRNQLDDAIELSLVSLKNQAKSGSTNVNSYKSVAQLMIQAGRTDDAADLMLRGYALATLNVYGIQTHREAKPEILPVSDKRTTQPWIDAILEFAAKEKTAGGKDFCNALGTELQSMIDEELKRMASDLKAYSGPLLTPQIRKAFELGKRVDAIYAAASGDWQNQMATAKYIQRLIPAGESDRAAQLIKTCEASIAAAPEARRAKVALDCAELLNAVLKTDEPPAAITPELVINAYTTAASAGRLLAVSPLKAALQLARTHKKHKIALDFASRLSRVMSKNEDIQLLYAEELIRAKQVDAADALFQRLLAEERDSQRLQQFATRALAPASKNGARIAARLLTEAARTYKEEIGLPDNELNNEVGAESIFLALLQARLLLSDLDRALDAYRKLQRNSSQVHEAELTALATAFKDANRIQELTVWMAKAVAAAPKDVDLRLAHATVLLTAGMPKAAIRPLQAAKAIDPSLETVKRLINVLKQAGEYQWAIDECRAWTDAFPQNAEAWTTLADLYKSTGNHEHELQALTMLVEVAPREADNCRKVAVIFAERKNYGRTVALLERAAELRPEEPYRRIDFAEALYLDGQYERAAEVCIKTLSGDWKQGLSPELRNRMPNWEGTFEVRTHSLLGDIYEKLRKPTDAAKHRSQLPDGYERPALKDAVPATTRPGWAGWDLRVEMIDL